MTSKVPFSSSSPNVSKATRKHETQKEKSKHDMNTTDKTYRDFSSVDAETLNDSSSWINQEIVPKDPPFPVKLHLILNNSKFEDIIFWLPHGRSWRILKQRAFEEKVIPLFFKHGRYASFARQVNGWGFQRVTTGLDVNSYYHELFLRGMPHLCNKMRRLTSRDIRNRKMEAGKPAPNFYELSRNYPLPKIRPQGMAFTASGSELVEHRDGVETVDLTNRATPASEQRGCSEEPRDPAASQISTQPGAHVISNDVNQRDDAMVQATQEINNQEGQSQKATSATADSTSSSSVSSPNSFLDAVNNLANTLLSSQNTVPSTQPPSQAHNLVGLPVQSNSLGHPGLMMTNYASPSAPVQQNNTIQQSLKEALSKLEPQAIGCLLSTLKDVLSESNAAPAPLGQQQQIQDKNYFVGNPISIDFKPGQFSDLTKLTGSLGTACANPPASYQPGERNALRMVTASDLLQQPMSMKTNLSLCNPLGHSPTSVCRPQNGQLCVENNNFASGKMQGHETSRIPLLGQNQLNGALNVQGIQCGGVAPSGLSYQNSAAGFNNMIMPSNQYAEAPTNVSIANQQINLNQQLNLLPRCS